MKNILIIEDDRMLNKGVAFALKKDGYNTMCAYTKEEGKKLIQQNEVDFLLLDIGLPDGSGLDLCNEIKEKIDFPINCQLDIHQSLKILLVHNSKMAILKISFSIT